MSLVVDASVASKWFFREVGSDAATKLLASGETLIAPQLIVAEVGNVALKRYISGEISLEQAEAAASATVDLIDELASLAALVTATFAIARDLRHPIYDCFYLALAEKTGARVVTADTRFMRRLAGTRWSSLVDPLVPPVT